MLGHWEVREWQEGCGDKGGLLGICGVLGVLLGPRGGNNTELGH